MSNTLSRRTVAGGLLATAGAAVMAVGPACAAPGAVGIYCIG